MRIHAYVDPTCCECEAECTCLCGFEVIDGMESINNFRPKPNHWQSVGTFKISGADLEEYKSEIKKQGNSLAVYFERATGRLYFA